MAKACQLLLVALVVAVSLLGSASADAGGKFRWCTTKANELQFCQNVTQFMTRIDPHNYTWECYAGGSGEACAKAIRDNLADVVNLDGSEVYTAAAVYGLKPVLKENFADGDTQYWAVAVVPKTTCDANPNIKLSDFKGKTACSTGYGRSAGWTIPVGYFLSGANPIMLPVSAKAEVKNDIETATGFFSKMCAAGDDPVNRVCTACGGDCTRNDPFYDYKGAFNCLMNANNGAGADIAFLKQDIVGQYAMGGSRAEAWAKKSADDYRLLCPQGGCASITAFTTCSFSRVPSHALMVRGTYPAEEVEELWESAALWNTDRNIKDALFSGKNPNAFMVTAAAQGVSPVNGTAQNYLGGVYTSVEAIDKVNKMATGTTTSSATAVAASVVGAVLAAAIAL